MSNNPFGNTLSTEGLEQAKDVLGGGGLIDSGVYTGKIKAAYAGKAAKSNALNMTLVVALMVNGSEKEYRETIYVTSKEGKNYYERNGEKNPLPGFTTVNDVALVTTGHDLNSQDWEERVVKIYDFDTKAEVPTKVQMAVNLLGKEVTLGILRSTVDKNKLNESTGQYEPTGETRDENSIDKVFHTESGKTVSEIAGKRDAEFQKLWADKNTGVTKVKAKGTAGKSGIPGQAASSDGSSSGGKGKSLFG